LNGSTNFTEFTDDPAMIDLATQSRNADLNGHQLAIIHRQMGTYLMRLASANLPMHEIEFKHVQGIRNGLRFCGESVAVAPLMRAGLFAGLGAWDVIPDSKLIPIRSKEDLEDFLMMPQPQTLILVDAVINTGNSLKPILEEVHCFKNVNVVVLSLVTPVETAVRLGQEFPEVKWFHARTSLNSYVGKGGTDTGNRLFGGS
jgi:uracil phosphoribosyltransferase